MNDASYDVEGLIREEGNQAIDETVEKYDSYNIKYSRRC